MLALQHVDHLSTCPDHRTITVGSHHMTRTIGIERRIESHACSHADLLHLSFFVDTGSNGMPAKLGHRTEGFGIEPSLIDGMSQTVSIDSCG